MKPISRALERKLVKAGVRQSAIAELKAFAMTFPKQQGYSTYNLLPRSRYDYGRDVGQGLSNSIVLAVVGWLMRNLPGAPLRIRQKGEPGELVDVAASDTGPGAVLSLMEYPNDFYSGLLLEAAIVCDYVTTGNAYVLKERNGSGRVIRLWWAPKIFIRPRWDTSPLSTGYIDWYEYNPNGMPFKVDPDDVVHFRDGLDPRNGREGLSKMAALAREIFTDDEGANFSATILANMGVPGVVLSPKDTGTSATNRITDPEGIKQSFMQKFGGDKRGEPLVMSSPTDVTMLSFNPQQLSLKDLRRLPEERVTAATGVNAMVAGLGAGLDRSTFKNYAEAREAAYEEAVIPIQNVIASDLKVQLLNEFVDDIRGYVVDFDVSEVRALQEDQGGLWDRNIRALAAGGITRRTFKQNIGEEGDDTDDVYYIPIATTVVNAEELPPPLGSELNPKAQLPQAIQAIAAGPNGEPLKPLVPRQLTGGAPGGLLAAGPATATPSTIAPEGNQLNAPGSVPAILTGP